MSRLSLRGIQNREAVEEDLRANKQVFERQLKQVNLMGEQMKPATSDEVVLGETIQKFVNAMLNKFENLSIILNSFDVEGGILTKPVLRKDLNIAPLIVDWNMIARSYINPANTQKQKDTIIQTILKLEQPVNSLKNQIIDVLNFIEINNEADDLIVEPVRLLVKVYSFLDFVSIKLESGSILPIQKNDIEDIFFNTIINSAFLTRLANIRNIQLRLFYGKPLQGLERQLAEQQLGNNEEEDASELGVDVLDNDEDRAVNFNMDVLPQVEEVEEVEEAGPSSAVSATSQLDQDVEKYKNLAISTLKNYIKQRYADRNTNPNAQREAKAILIVLDEKQPAGIEIYKNGVGDEPIISWANSYTGSGKLKGMGLYSSRKNRNQRIKFMPGPLDYNYERNDPYGNYRLE